MGEMCDNKLTQENEGLTYFENFCGACDYFGTLDCAFLSQVNETTQWKHIGCKNFWD